MFSAREDASCVYLRDIDTLERKSRVEYKPVGDIIMVNIIDWLETDTLCIVAT